MAMLPFVRGMLRDYITAFTDYMDVKTLTDITEEERETISEERRLELVRQEQELGQLIELGMMAENFINKDKK